MKITRTEKPCVHITVIVVPAKKKRRYITHSKFLQERERAFLQGGIVLSSDIGILP